MKIKLMNKDQLMNIYPAHAYYDTINEEIGIPDKELLFKSVIMHEYIHWLRKDKLTLKILSYANFFLIIIGASVVLSLVSRAMIFVSTLLFFTLIFSYFYEENIVQKKMLGVLNWEEITSQIKQCEK